MSESGTGTNWAARLAVTRSRHDRASTAHRVAAVLRTHITEGLLAPGTRLAEEAIGSALGVSRSTLREAFRLLIHEHLVVHELNRGVFVRSLTPGDVVEVYRVRRLIERAAIRAAAEASPRTHAAALRALELALDAGVRAAREERWLDVGTANMHFHQAIGAFAGSPRIDETMHQLLAENRLAFHVMEATERFHQPYLARHREILGFLRAGAYEQAESVLVAYLRDAERQLLDEYARQGHPVPVH